MSVSAATDRGARALVGREEECALVGRQLGGVSAGSGSALVLVGGPGVGKTALLSAASTLAEGARVGVLRIAGVPSEAGLPFAALHQALTPVCRGLARLPSAQQQLLRRVFGDGPEVVEPGDRFRVALAALDLLSDTAADSPLLLVVDDAHWVDAPSLEVLAFVGRRLAAEPLGLLVATREDRHAVLSGLPHSVVEPLDQAAAKHLLSSAFPDLPSRRSARILDIARGNPLALLELPSTVCTGITPTPAVAQPISTVIQDSFATRLATLPPTTATLLLLAAIENSLCVEELLSLASTVLAADVRLADLQPAIDARMVEVTGERMAFVHPLIAAAIDQSAATSDRHAAHAAVAAAVGATSDRGIWHRASAAIGRDDQLADDLDGLAARAAAQGAPAVAVTALKRSAALTVDQDQAGQRLLRAAEIACAIGQSDRALELLGQVDSRQWGLGEQVRVTVVEELAEIAPFANPARLVEIVDLADRLHDLTADEAAIGLLWNAATKCWRAGSPDLDRRRILAAAHRLDLPADHPLRLAIGACLGIVPARLSAASIAGGAGTSDMAALAWRGCTLVFLGDYPTALTALSKAIVAARVHGQFALIAQLGAVAAQAATWSGQLDLAATLAQEARRSAAELGLTHWAATAEVTGALVTAIRGDYHGVARMVEQAERDLEGTRDRYAFADWQHGLAVAALAAGEYRLARAHLERILDERDSACHYGIRLRIVGDLAEAITATEGRAVARSVTAALLEETRLAGTPVSRIAGAHATVLTSNPTSTEEAFCAALALDLEQWPLMRGRLDLAYGRWLRGIHRPVEARSPLRAARDAFARLGIRSWEQRARDELAATGEYSDQARPRRASALTAQEWQIATMAADGLTNRQIGQQLFLSHRTVGSHLYHLFPKLGVTSRNQLGEALAADADPGTD